MDYLALVISFNTNCFQIEILIFRNVDIKKSCVNIRYFIAENKFYFLLILVVLNCAKTTSLSI